MRFLHQHVYFFPSDISICDRLELFLRYSSADKCTSKVNLASALSSGDSRGCCFSRDFPFFSMLPISLWTTAAFLFFSPFSLVHGYNCGPVYGMV